MKHLDAANDNDAGKQIARTRQIWQPRIARGLWQTNGWASGIARNHWRHIAEEPDVETLKRSAAALAIWQESRAADETPVETYLHSRGLDLPASPVLRFHSGLKHPSGGVWPAMVALVTQAPPACRSPSTGPFSPATAAAKRRSSRRR